MTDVTGRELSIAGCKYLGIPYAKLDCQAFVEKALADCGLKKDLPGSNAWYREVMAHGWVGTPEDCRKLYGSIPVGAFLFILEHDGREPEKYKADGIGNASHIGIYTGMTGKDMCSASGVANSLMYNYGDGAIHSSQSRGCVCTSKFAGKTISGGWNRVGLYDPVVKGGGVEVNYQAKVVGGGLNLRAEPAKSSERLCQIPDGTIVTVTEETDGWSKTSYAGNTGWVVSQYLEKVDGDSDTILVPRNELMGVYNLLGDWLGLRG